MKRLIYGVALIGIASIGFAFMQFEKKDNPYCVEISCKTPNQNNWTKFKEVIYADYSGRASNIAKAKYPDCRIGAIREGQCK
jgi:hypothetical protein